MTDDYKCDVCGIEVTSALMAAMCPFRERCEFWPEDEESQQFLDSLGMRRKNASQNPKPARISATKVMDITKFRLAQEAWDYRAEPEPTDIDALESWTDAVIATIGRACRVAREGDWSAARDLLMSAARDLAESPMPEEL